ncbi:MAG: hypothetical protein GTO12_26105, partial [Proteobacteria bacterium]|nr:hypothetical protein [Pseudomonadota bacterium]
VRLGKVLFAFIRENWTPTDFMLLNSELTEEDAIKVVENLHNYRWDLKVTAGSTLPSNRIAKLEYALEMRREGIYDDEAVLKYSDDPNAEEVLQRKRIGLIEHLLTTPEGQQLLLPVVQRLAQEQGMMGGAGQYGEIPTGVPPMG